MLRGILRDILCIFVGYKLFIYGIGIEQLSGSEALIYSILLLGISVWFIIERLGLLPKM